MEIPWQDTYWGKISRFTCPCGHRERNRIGHLEKLGWKAVTRGSSANPMVNIKRGWPFRVVPTWREVPGIYNSHSYQFLGAGCSERRVSSRVKLTFRGHTVGLCVGDSQLLGKYILHCRKEPG